MDFDGLRPSLEVLKNSGLVSIIRFVKVGFFEHFLSFHFKVPIGTDAGY